MKTMAYSWHPCDPIELLGIRINRNKTEAMIPCPFCGSKRFGFNTTKGIGHCWSCEKNADSARYYAVSTGMSLYDARKDIEQRLGYTPSAPENVPRRVVYNTQKKEVQRASDEVLDRTYRAFLSELTLSEKNKNMLLARGFSEDEIAAREYKTFPNKSNIDFFSLCRRIQAEGCVLTGVPGFYKTIKGDFTFVQLTPGIIMPQRNHKDQIIGLQIRKDDDLRCYVEEIGDYEAKCAWFSSKNREAGCGAKAGVHYACDFRYDSQNQKWLPVFSTGFVLTEGIMKGDLTHALQKNLPVISVPGVHAISHLSIELQRLKEFGVDTILLCYDMDYKTNKNVAASLEKTKKMIEDLGLRCKPMEWETSVEGKNVLKGIDDYLAYCKLGIIPEIKEK